MQRDSLASNRKINTYQDVNDEVSLTMLKCPFEGIPDIFETTLVYYENNFKFDLGTSDKLLSQDLAINDPYDPYVSLGGKSANFYQQLMALYRYSRVFQADITVRYTDVSSANSCPTELALVLNSEQISYADMDDVHSLPIQRRRISSRYNNRIGSTYLLKGSFKPKDAFYMNDLQWNSLKPGSEFDNTNLGGIASPVTLSVVSVYYGRIDEANTDQLAIRGTVQISFLVRFYSRQSFSE